jgi:GDP-L-fucose synthase
VQLGEKIFIAGHKGLAGSAIVRHLKQLSFENLLLRTRLELDLRNQSATNDFFRTERPDYVFLAAARVGGILANSTRPAEFIYDNLAIETNVINAASHSGVKKLLFLGSSCIYPRSAPQPMKEDCLLTSALEPTNEWYAIAKIAGLKMCQAFRRQYGFNAICLMPTNLYGPGDNFDLRESHVIPALLRKFHEAKLSGAPKVDIWGTGNPRREFMHVDDLADACVYLMQNYSDEKIINVGVGKDISIGELSGLIQDVVGFKGELVFDETMPDGAPRKWLDISRLARTGWKARVGLRQGLEQTYTWYAGQYGK